MLESERNQFFNIKNQSLAVVEKINNLKRYQKIVDENITKNKQKDLNFNVLKNKILNDIKLVQKINSSQNLNSKKLNNEILLKELEIQNLENKIKQIKDYQNIDMKVSKEDLKEKVNDAIQFEQNKFKNEKKCIDIINTFYLIQKYFLEGNINDDNYNKDKLTQTKEFQQLLILNQECNIINKRENKRYLKEDNNNYEYKNLIKIKILDYFQVHLLAKNFLILLIEKVAEKILL